MNAPLLSVRGLQARYGESLILKDIDLDIMPNEVAVILGSSGSGKTTLLKNILGLEWPASGSVKYRGENIMEMDEARYREVLIRFGVLFQSGALLNSISVFDNIAIPLEQHSRLCPKVIERIIQAKLSLVHLDGAIYQLPSELSGGMRKRAALARAIALDPEILFCDEPTSGSRNPFLRRTHLRPRPADGQGFGRTVARPETQTQHDHRDRYPRNRFHQAFGRPHLLYRQGFSHLQRHPQGGSQRRNRPHRQVLRSGAF